MSFKKNTILQNSLILGFGFLLWACTSMERNSDNSSTKFNQYYLQGKQLYQKHCSNCHQQSGIGLGLVFPPLKNSDFMKNHFEEVICLIKNGKTGELIVNGKNFNKSMPAIPSLTNLEVAEIATYIYNTWGNQYPIIEVKKVDSILNTCNNTVIYK